MAEPTIKAKLLLDTGVGGVGGMASNAQSIGNGAGGAGVQVKGMKGLASLLARILSVLEIVNVAFGRTLKVLSSLLKVVGLILKPIGDILAVGLLPLIFLLKPLAKVVNILFKPFLRAALVSMKAGQRFLAEGDKGKAAQAFGMGAMALLTPISDMLMLQIQGLAQALLSLLQVALTPFLVVLSTFMEKFSGRSAEEIFAQFQDGFNMAREEIGNFFTKAIETTHEFVFGKIEELAEQAGMNISAITEDPTMNFTALSNTMTETMSSSSDIITTKIAGIMGLNEDMITEFRDELEKTRKEGIDPMTESLSGENGLNTALGDTISLFGGLKDKAGEMMRDLSKWVAQAKAEADKLATSRRVRNTIIGAGIGGVIGGPIGAVVGGIIGSRKVNDAIITKRGEVIHTDPQDNIIATKGGVGGNVNVSVSINAIDSSSISDSVVRNLTSKITENLKRELQGRSSYGVGI